MTTYQVELLEPKAKQLLEELANLKLISFQELTPKQEFSQLLTKIRATKGKELSLEEINKEVETVRAKRYAKEC